MQSSQQLQTGIVILFRKSGAGIWKYKLLALFCLLSFFALLMAVTEKTSFFTFFHSLEIPPSVGTLLVFRRSEHFFHGHKPYAGPRKVVQMNWVTDQTFVDHSMKRHGLSALFKKLNPFSRVY